MTIFTDHVDKMKLAHRLFDVLIYSAICLGGPLCDVHGALPCKLRRQKAPRATGKSQEAPQVRGQACTRTGAENKSSERRLQDGDTSSAQEEGRSCAKGVGEQT